MKLSDWLTTNNISAAEFADRIGISRQSIHRYIAGTRSPQRTIIIEISNATKGAVGPYDWFEETAA